ncbi:hypothetical protein [Pseudotenacibaculum haliotis]|uniref:Bacteriocin n=1 Tax=Pseudotenacibaculum haliotis TaxID=1862138 RepID=A0ABW5LPF8_9FLAO
MKKTILNFGKALNKVEQKEIQGGSGCPQIDPNECTGCGGYPTPNGCCLGDAAVWACLNLGGRE